jgi:hypothetical protein
MDAKPQKATSHGATPRNVVPATVTPEDATPETQPRFANYEEFFTFYLHEHSDPRNRAMHAAGTGLGLCVLVGAFVIGHPWYALLWPVVAYGFAWTGHFLIEGNKPATFGHPFWSFISDFRMLSLMMTGRLKARMDSASATQRPSA